MPTVRNAAALTQSIADGMRVPIGAFLAAAMLFTATAPAMALDGCLVLLCLAAPSWHAIPQCVPPIRQLLRDLALGRAFPACGMSGAGNTAFHRWSTAPDFCPPQYITVIEGESVPTYLCQYDGAVSVEIDGALWARTWWSMRGDTVTEFTDVAKATLGSWDSRFEDDYDTWLAAQPPAPPEPPPDCQGCGA